MKVKLLIAATILGVAVLFLLNKLPLTKETTPDEDISYIENQIDSIDLAEFDPDSLQDLEAINNSTNWEIEDNGKATVEDADKVTVPDFGADYSDDKLKDLQ